MAKKKTKRELKREQREQRDVERAAAQAEFEAKRRKYRIAALAIPLVTLGSSIGVYMATDEKQLAALVGLLGIGIWILVILGLVGSSVKPRDRTRAGSIDFGSKR
jgi:uncharacterized membrane protein YfcA